MHARTTVTGTVGRRSNGARGGEAWPGGPRILALALVSCIGWLASGPAIAGERYLRAGVGADRPAQARFTDRDCASESPAALYGCGRGGDGEPLRSVGEFETANAVELAVGYRAAPSVRLEVVADYRSRVAFEGNANFLAPGREQSAALDASSLSLAMAAQIDLVAVGVPSMGPFEPFIGAGFGRVRHRVGDTRITFPRTETLVPGGSGTEWTWTLSAGLAWPLGERATLDVAWRYTDEGEVETGAGAGHVRWRDGSREIPLDLAPTRARLTRHGIRLTVRYAY